MKLIDRYTKSYLVYAGIVLIAAIPLFYFCIQLLVSRRIDVNLLRQKKAIVNSFPTTEHADLFAHAVFLEPGIKFTTTRDTTASADKFSTVFRYDETDHDLEPWRILQTTVFIHNKPYRLELSNSLLDKEELISGIVVVAVIIFSLFVMGLFAINRALSVAIWKPFYHTMNQLKEYTIQKDEVLYFEKTKVDEFAELNDVIHALTLRNAEVYDSQKTFIENVSHEMQTPVAIQQVKLELLLQSEPLSEAQYKLIADLMDATQQSGTLHNSLLLLAKIDNRQFREAELFSVHAMVKDLTEQFAFQAEMKKIIVHLKLTGDIHVLANKGLVEIMLGNLLNNAIRHNREGGTVQISESKNSILFTNTAVDGPINQSRLFQRFHGKAGINGSTGLGLHIAKKIADLYGLSLQYEFVGSQHRFTLTL